MQKLANRIVVVALSLVLALAVTFTSTTVLQRSATTSGQVIGTPVSLGEIVVTAERAPALTKEDILWLARVIYSETKRPSEQELVAWVVRNRVETGYRGKDTYRDVVLDRYQFSAFNPNTRTRSHYAALEWNSTERGFARAVAIAANVATAEWSERPFSETTRHFYSRRSMPGGATPAWAQNAQPVALDRDVEPDRFRFYANVS
jgi:spore germination cell wall hydrolase CwlJ-like protein